MIWTWAKRRQQFSAVVLGFAAFTTMLCQAAELPPEIQADRYLVRAERQIQAGDAAAAVATLDKILALQKDHGLGIPAAFWFKHAQASLDAKQFEKAATSATRYLGEAGRGGKHYLAALEILEESEQLLPRPITVLTEPGDALVRILDVDEPYRQGLQLPAGEYRVEVSAEGYGTTVETVRHGLEALTHRVVLSPWAGGEHFQDCPTCPEMVVIPAGRFQMGCVSGQSCSRDERPVHDVVLDRVFGLSVHEVTFADWGACLAAGGCNGYQPGDNGWGRGSRPVINVGWEDARAYLSWLSQTTGRAYRLPSESEWEYAALAGTTTVYFWGDQIGHNRANCDGCGSRWDLDRTAPAGAFAPNAFGLHDVHGNVWEWVEDCWNKNYQGAPSDGSSWTIGNCSRRVLRGGSWYDYPRDLRSANRYTNALGNRDSRNGFRVARTISP